MTPNHPKPPHFVHFMLIPSLDVYSVVLQVMESTESNAESSVIKLEPEDFLRVVSLPLSADAIDDLTADDDDQESLNLVTSLPLFFKFLQLVSLTSSDAYISQVLI